MCARSIYFCGRILNVLALPYWKLLRVNGLYGLHSLRRGDILTKFRFDEFNSLHRLFSGAIFLSGWVVRLRCLSVGYILCRRVRVLLELSPRTVRGDELIDRVRPLCRRFILFNCRVLRMH